MVWVPQTGHAISAASAGHTAVRIRGDGAQSYEGTEAEHWHEFLQPRSELAGRRPKYPSSAGGEAFGD